MRLSCWFAIPLIAFVALDAQTLSKAAAREAKAAVAATLDDWHLAAAQAEEERYFNHMAPEAVFVGIDAQERWTKTEFRKMAHPGFAARQIWNFKSSRRDITLAPSGEVAWFDELLDTTSMGTARGSGVLVKEGEAWLIAQYSLSLPIPRAGFAEVKQIIESLKLLPGSPEKTKPRPER